MLMHSLLLTLTFICIGNIYITIKSLVTQVILCTAINDIYDEDMLGLVPEFFKLPGGFYEGGGERYFYELLMALYFCLRKNNLSLLFFKKY